jgi:TolA-binding protein
MRQVQTFVLLLAITCTSFLVGCSSSKETQETLPWQIQRSATEIMRDEMINLRASNDSLKRQITKLEQDNRATTAHAAELETQLMDMKTKLASTPPPPPPKPRVSNTRESYDHALQLFRSRDYDGAAAMFQSVLDAGAPEDLEDNCVYWIGECAYGEKQYRTAIEQFQKVFGFTNSEKKDDAQIMIANSYYAMGNKVKARAEYEALLDKFPASPYSKSAKAKLDKLK